MLINNRGVRFKWDTGLSARGQAHLPAPTCLRYAGICRRQASLSDILFQVCGRFQFKVLGLIETFLARRFKSRRHPLMVSHSAAAGASPRRVGVPVRVGAPAGR